MENQSGKKIKYLQSDNGPEYMNKEFNDFVIKPFFGFYLRFPWGSHVKNDCGRLVSEFFISGATIVNAQPYGTTNNLQLSKHKMKMHAKSQREGGACGGGRY